MRTHVALGLAALVVGLVVGAAVGAASRGGRGPSVAAPALRPSEVAGPATVAVDGPLAFRVLGWRCGIRAVVGDHADWLPDGQYCRVRLRVANRDRPVTTYDTALQALRASDGREFPADLNATQISDQPTTTEVKSRAVLEFDVWFEIPADAEVVAAVLRAGPATPGAEVALTGA